MTLRAIRYTPLSLNAKLTSKYSSGCDSNSARLATAVPLRAGTGPRSYESTMLVADVRACSYAL